MKKNIIIIALIFILPMIAYAIMSESNTVSAAKHVDGQPQVIKFSSKLCLDCKKIKSCFDNLVPKYNDNITFIEYDVQQNTPEINDAINKYGISLVPTVIYIDKSGKEVRRTEGFVEKNILEDYFKELMQ